MSIRAAPSSRVLLECLLHGEGRAVWDIVDNSNSQFGEIVERELVVANLGNCVTNGLVSAAARSQLPASALFPEFVHARAIP